jgi:hypothetical protein
MTTTSGNAAWEQALRQRKRRVSEFRRKRAGAIALLVGIVLFAHWGSGHPAFRSEVAPEPGWERFRAEYDVGYFGKDGQFVRAVQNGYNLVSYTYKYAPRFTTRTAGDHVHSCVSCHSMQDFAYGFVNSDRFSAKLGRRISFEEQVQRCYVEHLDGHVPTIYDPAVRDIRLLSRAVAHHLQLTEGALRARGGEQDAVEQP